MTNELLRNLKKLHTTELGAVRIKRNLGLESDDVVAWCKNAILEAAKNIENEKSGRSGENSRKSENEIFRKGKNWYIKTDGCTITVNAYSYTVITAHGEKCMKTKNKTGRSRTLGFHVLTQTHIQST